MREENNIYDPNNIFAKIIRNEISSNKVWENEDYVIIMDIMPKSPGHCLVIPKKAARNIFDVEDQLLQKLILAVKTTSKAVMQAFKASGISILQNNEKSSGQCVFHLHFHIVPSYDNGHNLSQDIAENGALLKQYLEQTAQ